MTGEKYLVFSWERVLFIAYLARSQLVLRWRSIDSSVLSMEQETGGNSRENKLDENSSADKNSLSSDNDDDINIIIDISRQTSSPSTTNLSYIKDSSPDRYTTSFDVSTGKDCEVIAARISFDKRMFKKQPVLLLKCVSVEGNSQNVEYLFIQVKEMSCVHNSDVSDTNLVGAQMKCKASEFSLVLLQSYSFNTSHNSTWHSHLVFIPDLQLLLTNPEPNSTAIMFCSQDSSSSHDMQINYFSLAASCESMSDVKIVDAFSVAEDRAVIALVSYKTPDRLTKCQCLKFSPKNGVTSHTTTESYNMVQLPVEVLFAADYAEILKVASISSFTRTYNLMSRSTSFHASLTMLTQTGYALKFSDGVLQRCINLTGYNDMVEWSQENWSNAFVNVINFDGCPDRTAVQVGSTCHLIDWTTEKIVKSWQSVFSAVNCDVQLCGISSLILVFQPKSAESPDTVTSHQLLQESVVAVIDVDDGCADTADGTVELDSDMTRQGSQQSAQDGHVTQPLCAASALVGQQRQCQRAVTEMESQRRTKLSLLCDTWQHLANLHVSGDSQALSQTASPDQLSLTVLVEGSVPSLPCPEKAQGQNDCRYPMKKYVETGMAWKRIVDLSLIVGVQVRNVSQSHLRDVQINIIPVPHCQTSILETISKCSMPTSNLADVVPDVSVQFEERLQGKTNQIELGQDSELNRHNLLLPGKSIVAVCTADISRALSAHDLTFHLFLTYSVISFDKCPVEESSENQFSVEEYCVEIVVTRSQLLGDGCCIGASRELAAAALTTTDLLALDCIHKHWTLVVQTVVSSVTCLSLRLSQDPRMSYLEWAEQFLFVATHELKYCRLQILEQSSRHHSTIKIFARSHSQALLLVTFLYSIVPEDATITVGTSHDMSAISHIKEVALQDVERQITAIKHVRAASAPGGEICVTQGHGTSVPQEGSLSPKFLTTKQVKSRSVGTEARVSVPDASSSTSAESAQGTGDVGTEKRLFHGAKRRFRDIWGHDSP